MRTFFFLNVDGQGTQSIIKFKEIKEVLKSKFYWSEWLNSLE